MVSFQQWGLTYSQNKSKQTSICFLPIVKIIFFILLFHQINPFLIWAILIESVIWVELLRDKWKLQLDFMSRKSKFSIDFLGNIGLVPNLIWLIEVLLGKPGIFIVNYFLCKAYECKIRGHRRDFNLKVPICLELGLL